MLITIHCNNDYQISMKNQTSAILVPRIFYDSTQYQVLVTKNMIYNALCIYQNFSIINATIKFYSVFLFDV